MIHDTLYDSLMLSKRGVNILVMQDGADLSSVLTAEAETCWAHNHSIG